MPSPLHPPQRRKVQDFLLLLLLKIFKMAVINTPNFSFLSLNVARQATLGGLALVLDQLPSPPSLIFLQEANLADDRLLAAAGRLGYTAHISPPAPGTDRRLVLFHNTTPIPTVSDITPGYAQLVSLPSVSFLHIHAPSGSNLIAERNAFFRRDVTTAAVVATATASLPSPPILLGDFNCVLSPIDTLSPFPGKDCPSLSALVTAFSLTDAYPHLHPLPSLHIFPPPHTLFPP
jgi:hypothetical protein